MSDFQQLLAASMVFILIAGYVALLLAYGKHRKRLLDPSYSPEAIQQRAKKFAIESVIDGIGYGLKFLFGGAVLCGLLWVVLTWGFGLDDKGNLDATASVYKCLTAIEDRNWDNYAAAFEPSAVLHATSPGLSVHFLKPQARVIERGDQTAVVEVNTTVKVDGTNYEWPLAIRLNVVKVNRASIVGSLGLKKWYVAARDVSQVPFNFSY